MEWGASHGRAALLLRVKERSQVDVLIITCLVGSAESLSPDLDLLRQVSKRGGVFSTRGSGMSLTVKGRRGDLSSNTAM